LPLLIEMPSSVPVPALLARRLAVSSSHVDRMPLILEREGWSLWLGDIEGDPTTLLRMPAVSIVTCRQISRSGRPAR